MLKRLTSRFTRSGKKGHIRATPLVHIQGRPYCRALRPPRRQMRPDVCSATPNPARAPRAQLARRSDLVLARGISSVYECSRSGRGIFSVNPDLKGTTGPRISCRAVSLDTKRVNGARRVRAEMSVHLDYRWKVVSIVRRVASRKIGKDLIVSRRECICARVYHLYSAKLLPLMSPLRKIALIPEELSALFD